MDPYIEACGLWEDFHNHLIEKMAEQLADAVPERYFVRTGERSYQVLVEEEGKKTRPILPDVSIGTAAAGGRKKPGGKKGGAAVTEPEDESAPVTLRAFVEEDHIERFVEIYEADPEHHLIAAIEVLSPSNKQRGSEGRAQYLKKRQSFLLGEAHLVEIDLLRGGERMPMLDHWPASPYTLLVARAGNAQLCCVWPAHFRHPLPVLPVPLAKPDPAVSLNLQPLIDDIYRRFRYERSIKYDQPLTPPPSSDDAAWLEQRLRARQG
jgi:hypothetical protein